MAEVTLAQMLQVRDERAETQRKLISRYRLPLVCFTMNIAGPVKYSPLVERAFLHGLNALQERIAADRVLYKDVSMAITGCQAFLVVDMSANELKEICVSIESANRLGRLFDIDVLDTDGHKLERREQRGCIVCGAAGRNCAASRRHSVEELQNVTNAIIYNYFSEYDREYIGRLAKECLIREVDTTPKPGLVDRRNNGSHQDMTLSTFYASATALEEYFSECVDCGRITAQKSAEETFTELRALGKQAEAYMYKATNGVNTHKGAIYSLGVLCGAIGRLWTPERPFADLDTIMNMCRQLVERSIAADFATENATTAGLKAYRNAGITGIRGEVADGFPSVINVSLPAYLDALNHGIEEEHAGAITLLHLVATVQDTALYHRGGTEGVTYAAESARDLLKRTPYPSTEQIEALDDAFIQRNLSPGGSADLLAVTYFVHKLLY